MPNIEVSIIVQLREITDDGRAGRCAIGIRKFSQQTGIPTKTWREKFDAAVRSAIARRTEHLAELRHLVRPAQLTLGLQRVDRQVDRHVESRRRSALGEDGSNQKKGSHGGTPPNV